MTSSPGPTPMMRSAISMQAVAELRHTALEVPQHIEIRCSNSLVFGPVVIHPEPSTSDTMEASASVMSGGENGMFRMLI